MTARDAAAKLIGGPVELQGREPWLRIRGVPDPAAITPAELEAQRSAFRALGLHGFRICVLLMPPASTWKTGTRVEPRSRLSIDLREASAWMARLQGAYGDFVDAWEVDNEPDLGFLTELPENYAAFLKACWLGAQQGGAVATGAASQSSPTTLNTQLSTARVPRVLMASLGLPPGPWLERFVENDGLSYMDGFNYHYYGYAEDFSGVYRAFENAVTELATKRLNETQREPPFANSRSSAVRKDLPIFLSEIGYGMLGKTARTTKEGRLRQWRWFKSVSEQVGDLRIEAPMAFYLPPYLEHDTQEFGLTVPKVPDQGLETKDQRPEVTKHKLRWRAGGIEYTPEDFGVAKAELWMELVGKDVAGHETTPALAWWIGKAWDQGLGNRGQGPEISTDSQLSTLRSQPSATNSPAPDTHHSSSSGAASRSWFVHVAKPSPIVIDFIAGDGLRPIKGYSGNFVMDTAEPAGRKAGGETPGPATSDQKPKTDDGGQTKSKPPAPRRESFMVHLRGQNGSLFEVYPVRQATESWQDYFESRENFTMSFYGHAGVSWRLADTKPLSLVFVFYPKQKPAIFEFRGIELIALGQGERGSAETARSTNTIPRFGTGEIALYNFSNTPVRGRLKLLGCLHQARVAGESREAGSIGDTLELAPGERRLIETVIRVDGEGFARTPAEIVFEPLESRIPVARFRTEFFPALEGIPATTIARPTEHLMKADFLEPSGGERKGYTWNNRDLVKTRWRATEEEPMKEQLPGVFAQHGAQVQRTVQGFIVTVSDTPPGKEQRVEVEIAWPDDVEFPVETFLSMGFRLVADAGN